MYGMIRGFDQGKRTRWFRAGLFLFFLFPLTAFSAVEYDLVPAPDKSGRWGYVDAGTKKTVIAPQYRAVAFFQDGVAIVTAASGQKGLIDRKGKIILPAEYTTVDFAKISHGSATDVSDFFIVSQGEKKGVVRRDGSWALPLGKYESIRFFRSADNGDYFRFDSAFWINGQVYAPPSGFVISSVIGKAEAFEIESKAQSSFSTPKVGVMRPDGTILIRPEYDKIQFVVTAEKRWIVSRVDGGVLGRVFKAVVTNSDIEVSEKEDMLTFWLLDGNGKTIREFRGRYHPFVKDGRVSCQSRGEKYEINPLDGERLTRDTSRKVGSRYVLFQERGFWGVRNTEGTVLINPQYVSLGSLGSDLFVARKMEGDDTRGHAPETWAYVYAENAGVINIANQVVMPFEYTTISSLDYPDRETASFMIGKIVPKKGTRYGIADRSGRVIVSPQYLNGFYMNSDGQAQVYRDGWHGVIDHTGKEVLPLVYRSIFDTARLDRTTKTFYMAEKDGLWGLYDVSGKEVVPHQYGFLSISEDDLKKGWVRGDSTDRQKRGAYHFSSRLTIPAVYDDIRIYDYVLTTYRRAEKQDSRDEKDILDMKGRKLATYHRLESLTSGRFLAKKDELTGVLDSKGKVLVSLKHRYLERAEGNLLWAKDENGNRFFLSETGEEYRIRD